MFFRAESLKAGFIMFGKIFTDFHISYFWNHRFKLHLDAYDLIVALVGVLVVVIVGFIRERNRIKRENRQEDSSCKMDRLVCVYSYGDILWSLWLRIFRCCA